ncbi:hypothetical protein DFH06DRAFT_1304445 [Mycena polygramma]|nr:hypothetical protein DFH06DRAFT_1304445 [Mycena polygramma]
MHQALRISQLTGLPAPIQQTAQAALTGSLENLHQLVIGMSDLSDPQAFLLLPVFNHTIQKLATPTTDELDDPDVAAMNSPVRRTLTMAFAAIRGVVKLGIGKSVPIPAAACREVWPPMANWLRFLLTFHENLRWLGGPSEELLCIDIALFAAAFENDRPTAALFAATPGFGFMIGRALLYLLKNDTFILHAYFFIRHFLVEYLDVGNRDNLDEFVAGAGGSFDELAGLIIDKINRLVPTDSTRLSQDDIVSFRFLLSVVIHIAVKTETSVGRLSVMGPLTAAFVPHGGAQAFTVLALALARSKLTDPQIGTKFVFEKCLMTLSQIFASPGGHVQLSESLECGLLTAVVSGAKFGELVFNQSSTLLNFILLPFTVYHTVLSKMAVGLLDAAADERAPEFTSSELAPMWSALRASVKDRLEALESFRARESEYKACDNDECGKMSHKMDFKRCGGCKSSYYCSAACQAHDWRHGGHAESCAAARVSCLNEDTVFGARDRSFLRALLHYDYCRIKVRQVHLAEIKFMHSRPGTPYFVLFDYRLVFPEISVKAIAEADDLELGPNRAHNVARAERSGGRIQLHVMRLRQDDTPTYWLIPLRTNTSWVHDGLRKIAAVLPANQATWDTDGILRQIRTLVEHALETH